MANGLPKTSYVKMVDVWLIFNLIIPFVEVNKREEETGELLTRILCVQVLLQTHIEYLRGKIEDSQTINHHGKKLEIEDGKVVGISQVGGDEPVEVAPVEK